MILTHRSFAIQQLLRSQFGRFSSSLRPPKNEVDSCGTPRKPTWSVHQLLLSYPTPEVTGATLEHIHGLAALIAPEKDSPDWKQLKKEMTELVRLVEAVKLVDTSDNHASQRKASEDADRQPLKEATDEPNGVDLLRHASRVQGGMYVVDVDRKK